MDTNWRSSWTVFTAAFQTLWQSLGSVAWLWLVELVLLAVLITLASFLSSIAAFFAVFAVAVMFVYRLLATTSLIAIASGRPGQPGSPILRIRDVLRRPVLLKLPAAVALAILLGVGISIASLFLLIPGILLSLYWSMSLVILIVEDTSVRDALRRSVALVRGWFWPLLSRMVFVFTILTLFTLPAMVPGIGAAVTGILSFLLAPVLVFYYVQTYQELAENKRYKHLQQAIVPLAAKLAIVAWLVVTVVVFAFVGSFAAYVSDVAQANSQAVELSR